MEPATEHSSTCEWTIRPMAPGEGTRVARLIFESTNHWFAKQGIGKIFRGSCQDCQVYCEVYEDLDPGCCLVAESTVDGTLLGSCFYHPRDTHTSLGIMNVHPDKSRQGVAKALLMEIVRIAFEREKVIRLFSSAFNLDSFSLYTRSGFVPYGLYQAMFLPARSFYSSKDLPPEIRLRTAITGDAKAIDRLEVDIWSTSRRKDWSYFIENRKKIWHVTVAENKDRRVIGALASVNHPGCNSLGPGIARDEPTASALIRAELAEDCHQPQFFYVPATSRKLVRWMYDIGARNCELILGQCLGTPPRVNGIVMPTLMPETG